MIQFSLPTCLRLLGVSNNFENSKLFYYSVMVKIEDLFYKGHAVSYYCKNYSITP